jgi:hypothetical protein
MSDNDESSARSKSWVWMGVLGIILITLLSVPFMAMGVALTKACFPSSLGREKPPQSSQVSSTSVSGSDEQGPMSNLRTSLEKAAGSVIKMPQVKSKMEQIQILAPPASITRATNEIHKLLSDRKLQFVEAVDNDRIRIVVIISSHQWAEFSSSLQEAIQRDGYIYHGPSQTATVGNQADSMIAEIEILKKGSN